MGAANSFSLPPVPFSSLLHFFQDTAHIKINELNCATLSLYMCICIYNVYIYHTHSIDIHIMYAPMMNNVNLFKESHISYDICMYLHITYIQYNTIHYSTLDANIHTYINTLGIWVCLKIGYILKQIAI